MIGTACMKVSGAAESIWTNQFTSARHQTDSALAAGAAARASPKAEAQNAVATDRVFMAASVAIEEIDSRSAESTRCVRRRKGQRIEHLA